MVTSAALLLVMLAASQPVSQAHAGLLLSGVVLDDSGSPIEGADVSAWLGGNLVASERTGADGLFGIQVASEARHIVYVTADDDDTPGVDHLPSRAEAAPSEGEPLRFTLAPAASLIFEGAIQLVESEELPYAVGYAILDPAGEAVKVGGLPLRYGSAPEGLSRFLGLEPSHLVVPAGVPFTVEVNASILVGNAVVPRVFRAEPARDLPLRKGDLVVVDGRRYSLPFNLGIVGELQQRVESRIGEMEALGFYLAREKGIAASAARLLSEAWHLYGGGRYIQSFDAAKRSFIAQGQTLTDLAVMYGDAALSVHLLIFFLGFSSTAIAFTLSSRGSTKLLGSALAHVAAGLVLYHAYPGSVMIPRERFAGSAALALATSLTVAVALPRLLKGRGAAGRVPARSILIPIFSIAKRGITRRRLRFALTLTSLTVLVTSFVALTSFSGGYGLITSRVSGRGPTRGVLVRAQGFTQWEPIFMAQRDLGSGWLERQPESGVVSPRSENLPLPRPVSYLNGRPISGVVGFDAEAESAIIDVGGILREGVLPAEGGVLISEALRRELGVEVGGRLTLEDGDVVLQGVFDDEAFRRMRDLDGETYAPKKLVNIAPEGEVPRFVVEPCDPSEVIVTHISTALRMPFVGVTRVAIAVDEGVDVNAFAERLALERGYQAWSSSVEGVYLSRLGGYLEGKGLQLAVPWAVVVLNVVATMLNSMYERRREVHILSSVGLNPAHITAVFVAEASILGLISGGVGYLAGLGLYRLMAFFGLGLEVQHKVSSLWSLAAIGVAMTAVLMGALVALRSSIVVTPSMRRRWMIEEERRGLEPWESTIPVRLLPEEVEGFFDFVVGALRALEDAPDRSTSSVRVSRGGDGAVDRIDFVYKSAHGGVGSFFTRNALLAERRTDAVGVRLRSYGEREWAYAVGSMVRLMAMEWSALRRRGGAEDPP